MKHGQSTIWKGSIRHSHLFECPLLDNPVKNLEVELVTASSSTKSTVDPTLDLDLETIAYINYKAVPLWCITSNVMNVYSDSETTAAFFQRLLDNNNDQMSIGMAIRCQNTLKELLIYFEVDAQTGAPRTYAVWTNYRFDIEVLKIGKQLSALNTLHTNLKTSSSAASRTSNSLATVVVPQFLTEEHQMTKLQELEQLYQQKIRDIQAAKAKPTDKLDAHVRKRSATPFDRAVQLSRTNSEIYRLQPRKNPNRVSQPAVRIKHETPFSSSSFNEWSPAVPSGARSGGPPDSNADPEVTRNYKLLKQIIMAAFRLRGINREVVVDGSAESSEHEALFVETFRSLAFAFRAQLKGRIPVEEIEEKIDKQLSVYLD